MLKSFRLITIVLIFTTAAQAEDHKLWLGIGGIAAGTALTIVGARAQQTVTTYTTVAPCAGTPQAYACANTTTYVPPTTVASSQSLRVTNWKLAAPGIAMAAAGGAFLILHKHALISFNAKSARFALNW